MWSSAASPPGTPATSAIASTELKRTVEEPFAVLSRTYAGKEAPREKKGVDALTKA